VTPNALRIDPQDNVVTLLCPIARGGTVVWAGGGPLDANQDVPAGHKVAIEPIPAGEIIRKYGHPIGAAAEAIAPGDHVHTHNLAAAES
jgi:altronate hydrolase